MACGSCGANKNAQIANLKGYQIENGFYIVDLCGGYRLKFKTSVYYLENSNNGELFPLTKQQAIDWAKNECNVSLDL